MKESEENQTEEESILHEKRKLKLSFTNLFFEELSLLLEKCFLLPKKKKERFTVRSVPSGMQTSFGSLQVAQRCFLLSLNCMQQRLADSTLPLLLYYGFSFFAGSA